MKNERKLKAIAGHLPCARQHILSNIPLGVIDKITTKYLQNLVDAMHLHFLQGMKHSQKEIEDFLCLPTGIDFWQVIGYGHDDNINVVDVLETRGNALYQRKQNAKIEGA